MLVGMLVILTFVGLVALFFVAELVVSRGHTAPNVENLTHPVEGHGGRADINP